MGYDWESLHSDTGESAYEPRHGVDESDGVQELRLVANASGDHPERYSAPAEEMRIFLVACHQASVSIDTMSKYLGLDADTVRSELLRGIADWNAAQRTTNEAVFKPRLLVAASCD